MWTQVHLLPEQDVGLDEGPNEGHALLEVDDVAAGSLNEEVVTAGLATML